MVSVGGHSVRCMQHSRCDRGVEELGPVLQLFLLVVCERGPDALDAVLEFSLRWFVDFDGLEHLSFPSCGKTSTCRGFSPSVCMPCKCVV